MVLKIQKGGNRMSNDISQEQKNIFAKNLNRLLSETGKSQSDLVTYFGITASTVSDWCNAKKFPRVDKVQQLADYFGVKKSDLIEENTINQSERKLLLLARHLEKIPEEKRQTLISNFENTIEMYLDALGITKED